MERTRRYPVKILAIIGLVLALCACVWVILGFSQINTAQAEESQQVESTIEDSGTCGDHLSWTLTSAGLLSITGTGEMTNYDYPYDAPWAEYTLHRISAISIGDGVTSIGDNAFYGIPKLTSITVPSSVVSIGDGAFFNCVGLRSVNLSNGLRKIHYGAFTGCTLLKSITIPASVEDIEAAAFTGCHSLSSVKFESALAPELVTPLSLGTGAFTECSSLTDITIPERATIFGEGIFYRCTKLAVVRVSTQQQYDIMANNPFYVNPENTSVKITLSSAVIAPLDVQLYTGKAVTPNPVVTFEGKTLVKGTDYTVSYKNNINAGVATVTVTGKGAFVDSLETTFEITRSIADLTVTTNAMAANYTGGALKPQITVAAGNVTLVAGRDYVVKYDGDTTAPVEIGSYVVTIEGQGSYLDSKEVGTFTIYDNPVEIGSTWYHIQSAFSPKFVLDVAGKQPVSGANVSIWTDNGGSNQLFTFELGEDGFYTLRNVGNNSLVLDAAGKKPVVGANVSTWTKNGGANQKWVLIPSTNGTFIIASSCDSNMVLDAAGNSPVVGANVSVWSFKNGLNQKWKFVEANNILTADVSTTAMAANYTGGNLAPKLSVKMYGKTLVENIDYTVTYNGEVTLPKAADDYVVAIHGIGSYRGSKTIGTYSIYDSPVSGDVAYHIQSAFDSDFVLDVAGKAPSCGSNVSLWIDNGGANQYFTFELGDDGFYVIRNVANPSLVLDAAHYPPSVGSNVSTWYENKGANQKWVIIPSDGGTFVIANAYSTDMVLDAAGKTPVIGANVSVWTYNNGLNQKWEFASDAI